jgi:hypothetical protein
MSRRICYLCGEPAKGYASVWSSEYGERFYCHGDEGESCYVEATVWNAVPVFRGLSAQMDADLTTLPVGTILRDDIGRVFVRTDARIFRWRTILGPGYDLTDEQATTYPVQVLFRPALEGDNQ